MLKFPKSLIGFYYRYGFLSQTWTIIFWFILFGTNIINNQVILPLGEKWFIALFETAVPAGTTFMQHALPVILLVTGMCLVGSITYILFAILISRWSPKVIQNMDSVLVDYVHNQNLRFFQNRMAGKISSQIEYINGGFSVLRDLCRTFFMIVVMLTSFGIVLMVNKYVAFLIGAAITVRIVYSVFTIKGMTTSARDASKVHADLNGKIIDSLTNFSIVKSFSNPQAEHNYLEPARRKTILADIFKAFKQRVFHAPGSVFWDLSYGTLLLLLAYLFAQGELTISDIFYSFMVFHMMMGMSGAIIEDMPGVIEAISKADNAYKELIEPIQIQDAPDARDLIVSNGKIEIKNLHFSFGKRKVIDNLNLTIKPFEKIGLVGHSGAGKTTLVNMLMRFYDPKRGEILIDGQNIRDITQDSLHKNISFIPQEPSMFNRTIAENISYGTNDATKSQIKAAAARAEADKFIETKPKKYDAMVGDRGIKLSGGEKQRIATARAFLKNAPILILDEATSALDSETENAIQKSFRELAAKRTTIVIAHRLSTLRNMDRIIVMDKGKIVEIGTHSELIAKNGIYAKLWEMQSNGFIIE